MSTQDFTLLVCGFGRCGTSLLMQMLAAGGYPVSPADGTAYEDPRILTLPEETAWLVDVRGTAIKLLDPHQHRPPADRPYKAIWMDRQLEQQARSQLKMVRTFFPGARINRRARKAFERSYRRDRPRALDLLTKLTGSPHGILIAQFEWILTDPGRAARGIAFFLDPFPLDWRAMADVVVPRSGHCRPDLSLEMSLLERKRTAAKI